MTPLQIFSVGGRLLAEVDETTDWRGPVIADGKAARVRFGGVEGTVTHHDGGGNLVLDNINLVAGQTLVISSLFAGDERMI